MKHTRLLLWRVRSGKRWTARRLAESLSVERLPYDKVPPSLYEAVVAFRCMRHDARIAACRTFLAERRP